MSDHERMLDLEAKIKANTATPAEIEECAYDRGWHAGFHAAIQRPLDTAGRQP